MHTYTCALCIQHTFIHTYRPTHAYTKIYAIVYAHDHSRSHVYTGRDAGRGVTLRQPVQGPQRCLMGQTDNDQSAVDRAMTANLIYVPLLTNSIGTWFRLTRRPPIYWPYILNPQTMTLWVNGRYKPLVSDNRPHTQYLAALGYMINWQQSWSKWPFIFIFFMRPSNRSLPRIFSQVSLYHTKMVYVALKLGLHGSTFE